MTGKGSIYRCGVNAAQIPSDVNSLREWHARYFVEKYKRDVVESDGYIKKDQLLIFPSRKDTPVCFQATTPFAYCSRIKSQDVRFDPALLETERSSGSMYMRPKTTVPGLKKLPAVSIVTLPGAPNMETQNARFEPQCATLDDWFALYGTGERTKETRKYIGSRCFANDTSTRGWVGTMSTSARMPTPQIFPHVGSNPASMRFNADRRLSPCIPPI